MWAEATDPDGMWQSEETGLGLFDFEIFDPDVFDAAPYWNETVAPGDGWA